MKKISQELHFEAISACVLLLSCIDPILSISQSLPLVVIAICGENDLRNGGYRARRLFRGMAKIGISLWRLTT